MVLGKRRAIFSRGNFNFEGSLRYRYLCDTVIFGSECGDLAKLSYAAKVAADEAFREEYRTRLSEGAPAAEAYFSLLSEYGVEELRSNDLLGIEYLRAARELGAELSFLTVRREGAGYLQEELSGEAYPSAMAIRRLWREGRFAEADLYLPEAAAEIFSRRHCSWISPEALDRVMLSYFRLHNGSDFSEVVGAESGIINRICEAARSSRTQDELLEKIKTKRYTDARLRRQLLFCLGGVTPEVLSSLPQYTTLLAANERGKSLLSEVRKNEGIRIITRVSDAPKDAPQFSVGVKISSVIALSMEPIADDTWQYQKLPYLDSAKNNS